MTRLACGNFSNTKSVGDGVFEYRLNTGPGYRLYFANDGNEIILLLGGGTKKGQQRDIRLAKQHWKDYKERR